MNDGEQGVPPRASRPRRVGCTPRLLELAAARLVVLTGWLDWCESVAKWCESEGKGLTVRACLAQPTSKRHKQIDYLTRDDERSA